MLLKKVPADIRWIFIVFLIFVITMTILRGVFFLNYNPTGKSFSGSAFFMGFRFDLKFASILALVLFVITRVPVLNPFKNSRSIQFWNILLTFVYLLLLVFYAADYYHYDYLRQRLNASVMNYLEDAAISISMMWESYPVVTLLVLIVIISIAAWFIFSSLLKKLLRTKSQPVKRRFLWYLAFFLLLGSLVFGKISQFNLRWSDAFTLSDDFKANLV